MYGVWQNTILMKLIVYTERFPDTGLPSDFHDRLSENHKNREEEVSTSIKENLQNQILKFQLQK